MPPSLANETSFNDTLPTVEPEKEFRLADVLTDRDLHAILGGVVGFWGGVFALGVVFLLMVAYRYIIFSTRVQLFEQ